MAAFAEIGRGPSNQTSARHWMCLTRRAPPGKVAMPVFSIILRRIARLTIQPKITIIHSVPMERLHAKDKRANVIFNFTTTFNSLNRSTSSTPITPATILTSQSVPPNPVGLPAKFPFLCQNVAKVIKYFENIIQWCRNVAQMGELEIAEIVDEENKTKRN
jgi:hypothetical protein